jgi:hypothetical protein
MNTWDIWFTDKLKGINTVPINANVLIMLMKSNQHYKNEYYMFLKS